MNIKEEILRILAGLAIDVILNILIPSVDRILISVIGFSTLWVASKLATMTSHEAKEIVSGVMTGIIGVAIVALGTAIFVGYVSWPIPVSMFQGVLLQICGISLIV